MDGLSWIVSFLNRSFCCFVGVTLVARCIVRSCMMGLCVLCVYTIACRSVVSYDQPDIFPMRFKRQATCHRSSDS
ncbi:hypothetical protein BDV29DRAFT_170699 [Aspergillus leporis]|uniref:Uncharacterized protein n=1 Tax=Aspergillus leporis TaxID=41062 RepID=A0A5N5X641_9EURO|nr:hypothetical protein BDV29DRAFT_170699 [Aspergillus leporis]